MTATLRDNTGTPMSPSTNRISPFVVVLATLFGWIPGGIAAWFLTSRARSHGQNSRGYWKAFGITLVCEGILIALMIVTFGMALSSSTTSAAHHVSSPSIPQAGTSQQGNGVTSPMSRVLPRGRTTVETVMDIEKYYQNAWIKGEPKLFSLYFGPGMERMKAHDVQVDTHPLGGHFTTKVKVVSFSPNQIVAIVTTTYANDQGQTQPTETGKNVYRPFPIGPNGYRHWLLVSEKAV